VFTGAIQLFQESKTNDEILEIGAEIALKYLWLGMGVFVAAGIRQYGFRKVFASQIGHIRQQYYRSVLRQDMSWHDMHNSAEVANRLVSDIERLSAAYDLSMSQFLMTNMNTTLSVVLALTVNWRLTLISSSTYCVVFLAFYYVSIINRRSSEISTEVFVKGAQVASEDIGLIKTIWSMCTQKLEILRCGVWLCV
jgi:ATP-binding cassette subfamily B (MDR/TAP) protein 1